MAKIECFLVEGQKRTKLSIAKMPSKIPRFEGQVRVVSHGIGSTLVLVYDRSVLADLKVSNFRATASGFVKAIPAPAVAEKPQPEKVVEHVQVIKLDRFVFSPYDGSRADFLHERKVWAEGHGSEDLNLAIKYGLECDTVYAKERAAAEFPDFEAISSSEVEDDPAVLDHTTLKVVDTYMRLDKRRFSGFRHMGSRVGIGTKDGRVFIIIRGYLGLCDLMRPFDEVLNVIEPN